VNISDALVRYGTALPVAPTVLPDVSQSHGGLQPCLSSSIAASISLSMASAAETFPSMGTLAGRRKYARPLFSPRRDSPMTIFWQVPDRGQVAIRRRIAKPSMDLPQWQT
jgi:hypothetical protein